MKANQRRVPNSIITPIVAIVVTMIPLTIAAIHVERTKYNPSTKTLRLM